MVKKKGWQASQEKRKRNARIRQNGMFVDLASLIMAWRLGEIEAADQGAKRPPYPPTKMMVDYLNYRGWKAQRGGLVDSRVIDEMVAHMDPDFLALPTAGEERVARAEGRIIPGSEICGFAIDPEGWMQFKEAMLGGWEPSWRNFKIRPSSDAETPSPQPNAIEDH